MMKKKSVKEQILEQTQEISKKLESRSKRRAALSSPPQATSYFPSVATKPNVSTNNLVEEGKKERKERDGEGSDESRLHISN